MATPKEEVPSSFEKREKEGEVAASSLAAPLRPISSKDLMQLKKKKKAQPGHKELVDSQYVLGNMSIQMKNYLEENSNKLYYVDRMKMLLFEDNPSLREFSEKVKSAIYKSLAITRTLFGSFPVYEHLKKRMEMILVNPKNSLKKGSCR